MLLHVRVFDFEVEDFALQLALVYTQSVIGVEIRPGVWMIGEDGGLLQMTDMAPEGYSDQYWKYFRLEFGDALKHLNPEVLRRMLLEFVPGAGFFDPNAVFEIKSTVPESMSMAEEILDAFEVVMAGI